MTTPVRELPWKVIIPLSAAPLTLAIFALTVVLSHAGADMHEGSRTQDAQIRGEIGVVQKEVEFLREAVDEIKSDVKGNAGKLDEIKGLLQSRRR